MQERIAVSLWPAQLVLGKPCLADALARILEVNRVQLDADESFASIHAGNAGSAAAHEWVDNGASGDLAANELHLS